MRAKALEPVTLVRSPTLTNRLPSPMNRGSRPDSSMGGTDTADAGADGEGATADMDSPERVRKLVSAVAAGRAGRAVVARVLKPDAGGMPGAATLLERRRFYRLPPSSGAKLAYLPGMTPATVDWHAQELLLLHEVMKRVGRSLSPEPVLHEMLHLMSELLGLNRGRIVLVDDDDRQQAGIRLAYGLTAAERRRGRYAPGEGITGRVLASGQAIIVQDIDAEPLFLFRSVRRK